ncbi:uncharacterized protein BDW43DRAFT_316894 [Aspergillus alliaceus]|uniref:uncharacterized protein n=1 Tax=Petromyces alliaceus TaxID=209559 RepID=UPI0012A69BC1|nr:uncharacterized protein BDW43DRAFT_316894 [Aspergillus alliaceus]KAB8227348.1 hypothetical protein BDW43DRAFT_316894 [Aspergillus alliaceus]
MRAAVAIIALQTAFQAALGAPQYAGKSEEHIAVLDDALHGRQYPRAYTNSQLTVDEPSEIFYEGKDGTAQAPPAPLNQNAVEYVNIPDDATKNDGGSSQSPNQNGVSKPDGLVGIANGGGSSGVGAAVGTGLGIGAGVGLGTLGKVGSGIVSGTGSGLGSGIGSGGGAPNTGNTGNTGVNSANTAGLAGAGTAATKPTIFEGDVSEVPPPKEPETQLINLDEEAPGSSGEGTPKAEGEVSPVEGEISQESSQALDRCFSGSSAKRSPPTWAKEAFREARDYAKSGKTAPGSNYPHEYKNFEKTFRKGGRLMEYPIDPKNQGYSGGNPGKSRLIIREGAKGNWEFEGVVEHQDDGTFKKVC